MKQANYEIGIDLKRCREAFLFSFHAIKSHVTRGKTAMKKKNLLVPHHNRGCLSARGGNKKKKRPAIETKQFLVGGPRDRIFFCGLEVFFRLFVFT